jgi:hypothetical protein
MISRTRTPRDIRVCSLAPPPASGRDPAVSPICALLTTAVWILSLLAAAPARANGALPDSGQIIAPPGGQTIILGTNFGLVISEDQGATWRWSCEHGDALGGARYALTADRQRMLGLTLSQLVASDDTGCHWKALPDQEGFVPFNYVTDGLDPSLIYALVEMRQPPQQALVRIDLRPGAGPAVALHAAPADAGLATLEVARSDSKVLYVTQNPLIGEGRTRIVRSADAGQTWAAVDPAGAPAYTRLDLIAVDPGNADTIYLRASKRADPGEALILSEDGGRNLREIFQTAGQLTAFLRLREGGILLGDREGAVARLHRSTAGGAFLPLAGSQLHIRALAERDGVIYAATDNVVDGYAIGRSTDQGATWQRLMGFQDIGNISSCGDLPSLCRATCSQLAALGVVSAGVCASTTAMAPPDASLPVGADGGVDAGGAPPPAGAPAGGCSLRAGPTPAGLGAVAMVLVAAAASGLRGWRTHGSRPRRRPRAPR